MHQSQKCVRSDVSSLVSHCLCLFVAATGTLPIVLISYSATSVVFFERLGSRHMLVVGRWRIGSLTTGLGWSAHIGRASGSRSHLQMNSVSPEILAVRYPVVSDDYTPGCFWSHRRRRSSFLLLSCFQSFPFSQHGFL